MEEGLRVHWGNYNFKSAVSASPLAVSFTKQLQDRRENTDATVATHHIACVLDLSSFLAHAGLLHWPLSLSGQMLPITQW